ncbi:type II toxin-antitoxin system toxin DNA ADP-ribosyl transferase DarT [Dyadobacter bucti]|uniref:type II toxin-antitoxin system toxin DNA ADP-ribosyl transferase DarT n=1 Tax=Dyadobacter bucti TaxID=2572203 RepID=UPI00197AF024|nr:DUF4433 domain-containing protein [Dyadobacter bucti]
MADIKIYRMLHVDNIPHILQYGITHKNSPQANPNFVTIGDLSLIDTRNKKMVRVDNGDLDALNVPSITLGDFIPFYFGVRMPMLYVMQHGGNFVRQATPPENIIYLACSVQRIVNSKINYFFSDGHGTDGYTAFYDRSKIQELPSLIDWSAVKSSYWGGQENLIVKRKKQAEFLVASDLPADFIIGYGCYSEAVKTKLKGLGIEDVMIKTIPQAYY